MRIISDPKKIEETSFRIIEGLLADFKSSNLDLEVVKRVIHATADLNYAKDLSLHSSAVKAALDAIRAGKNIVVDVTMVKAGINKKILDSFGGRVICLLNDREIVRRSCELRVTRAVLALRKASNLINGAIVAIGNAPTALFELCDLIKKGKVRPALIIGVPVGFVGAVEAKRELRSLKVPYITNKSRKGGSSVAAAIINALLKLAKERRRNRLNKVW